MDILNQILLFLLYFALSYFVASLISAAFKIYFNAKWLVEKQHRARLDAHIHRVKQEVDGAMHYWFDYDNDQFIAQGRTMKEIQEVLRERWAKHIFVLNDHVMLIGPDFDQVHFYNEKPNDQP